MLQGALLAKNDQTPVLKSARRRKEAKYGHSADCRILSNRPATNWKRRMARDANPGSGPVLSFGTQSKKWGPIFGANRAPHQISQPRREADFQVAAIEEFFIC